MRRLGPDEWSGLAVLVLCLGVGAPVLFGAVDTAIPRGWWLGLFVLLLAAIAVSISGERPPWLRYVAFATAVVSAWLVVVSATNTGLMMVFLVVLAALSVYVVPPWIGFGVIGLNTVVLAYVAAQLEQDLTNTVILVGFYLLIQLASLLSSLAIIREQRMRRELTEAHVELQAASVLLSESARTTERLRISRDLHDLIGHQLTVLTLELEAARHRDASEALEHVDRANRVARDLLGDVRSTVGQLRTESPNLSEALHGVVRDLPGLDVSIEVAPHVQAGDEQVAALVRAVQEIVTNTIRHAEARELWIEVSQDDGVLCLSAADDGKGASDPVLGNGLEGLIERFEALGGEVTIDGQHGFQVTGRVPAP